MCRYCELSNPEEPINSGRVVAPGSRRNESTKVGHHRREEMRRRLRFAVKLLAPRDSEEVKSPSRSSGCPKVRGGWCPTAPVRAPVTSVGGGVENINSDESKE